CERAGEAGALLTKWHLPRDVHRQHVPHVEVRRAAIGPRIDRILREDRAVRGVDAYLSLGLVDYSCECIRCLPSGASAEALRGTQLEGVVPGSPAGCPEVDRAPVGVPPRSVRRKVFRAIGQNLRNGGIPLYGLPPVG